MREEEGGEGGGKGGGGRWRGDFFEARSSRAECFLRKEFDRVGSILVGLMFIENFFYDLYL